MNVFYIRKIQLEAIMFFYDSLHDIKFKTRKTILKCKPSKQQKN